ncbi:hypothetical protein WKI65_43185 [Streptomyces sp. MS1.AVA.3]|uniref:hypothetical protein n=1 Tax=Streptomyces decoyicus TaxID=249567 RepID=UPI0030C3AE13
MWFAQDAAEATGSLLAPLWEEGWEILTDRRLSDSDIVLQHVLIPPAAVDSCCQCPTGGRGGS